jgi:hypothetical protein
MDSGLISTFSAEIDVIRELDVATDPLIRQRYPFEEMPSGDKFTWERRLYFRKVISVCVARGRKSEHLPEVIEEWPSSL